MGYRVPEEVWLTGKGPSLLSHKWQGDETIFCINQSVYFVPKPFAAIALDYSVLDEFIADSPNCIILRKDRHTQYQFENMWIWYMSDANLSTHATAVIAIQLLYKWGARKIHFVGFDALNGIKTYAKGTTGNVRNLDKISDEILRVIGLLEITPIWEF